MAKRKRKVRVNSVGYSRAKNQRHVKVDVTVGRTGHLAGPRAFIACAGTKLTKKSKVKSGGCAYGRNPRIAVGRALKKVGGQVSRRSGAFHGV